MVVLLSWRFLPPVFLATVPKLQVPPDVETEQWRTSPKRSPAERLRNDCRWKWVQWWPWLSVLTGDFYGDFYGDLMVINGDFVITGEISIVINGDE